MHDETMSPDVAVAPVEPSEVYEAPRVESVLTAEDLTREIQYAGSLSQIN